MLPIPDYGRNCEGKRIVITAGVTGLGQATAVVCAKEGAQAVVTLSRAPEEAERVAETRSAVQTSNPNTAFLHIPCDCGDAVAVNAAIDRAVDFMGGLDGAMSCAYMSSYAAIEDVSPEEMNRTMALNLNGTLFLDQACFRYMKKTGGSILNVASVSGVIGIDNMPAYSSSKGALLALSRLEARQWGRYNIRVNTLLPVCASENAFDDYHNKMDDAGRARYDAWFDHDVLLGEGNGFLERTCNPEASAQMAAFLLGDKAHFMTGQMIGVDGGMVMPR